MRLGAYAHNKNFPDARQMILDALGIDGDKIPRERAVYIGDDGPIIHTRTGGGNRDQYDKIIRYVTGEYGIDQNIRELETALTDYDDYRWFSRIDTSEYDNEHQLPYEFMYRPPETEEHWKAKEDELKLRIKDLQEQRAEVKATGAYTNEYLRRCSYYLSDEDDGFDSTYADFFYSWPEGLQDNLIKAGYMEVK